MILFTPSFDVIESENVCEEPFSLEVRYLIHCFTVDEGAKPHISFINK